MALVSSLLTTSTSWNAFEQLWKYQRLLPEKFRYDCWIFRSERYHGQPVKSSIENSTYRAADAAPKFLHLLILYRNGKIYFTEIMWVELFHSLCSSGFFLRLYVCSPRTGDHLILIQLNSKRNWILTITWVTTVVIRWWLLSTRVKKHWALIITNACRNIDYGVVVWRKITFSSSR